MVKTYLLKIILLLALFTQFFSRATAQYAIGGTAGPNLYNSVYWLTWDPTAQGSTMISYPAGANTYSIVNGTYVWQFSPTVRITAIISNEVFLGGATATMSSSTPGTYEHDGLDLIYSGNNLPKPLSRGVANCGMLSPYGGQVTFDIDVKVAILINGVYTDVVYPGMVIADAESIDSGGEFISGDTPNPISWQLINKRTEGNSQDSHYKMDLSNGGKSFKLYADLLPGNFGVQAVMFAHGARSLKNVSMKGSGLTAIAIGFVLPFDEGDAPTSYGNAGHYIDQFQITDYYGGDGTYSIVNYQTTPLLAKSSVYIGDNNVDPDGQPAGGTLANNDDIVGNPDESTFTAATLPTLRVNQAGNVALNVPVTNGKSIPATLYAWIDFNNDGVFSANEQVSVPIPANTTNQVFVLTFLNSTFSSKLKVGPLYARLRITTSTLLDDAGTTNVDERSFSYAADGEAEDYKLNDIVGLNISGTVFDDHNGTLDNLISGTAIQKVSGQQLYAYLVDNTGTVINKATVAADGTYNFLNGNSGTYTVAISTNNVATGSLLAAVAANLPAAWQPAGETYGINNTGNTGIETGTPNCQIQVVTPGSSLDVTGVNFGLNQIPISVADVATTTIGTPVTLDVPANDLDPDGTLDLTKVLLIDAADNVKKTTVTIAGQGTYTVNATTGKVTFTPLATFTGKSTILYTIKDDGGAESASALITVSVKPVGTNDVNQTPINTPVTTTVTTNDGPSATGATVSAGTPPAHGSIIVNPSGTITYTPAAGYVGIDTYTYILTTPDGTASDPITVTITVYTATYTLTKAATNSVSKTGDIITYSLVVTNTGTSVLSNIAVTDAGADAGSISPALVASLAVGASTTVTASHTVTQTDVNAGLYSNQAAATATDPKGNVVTKPKSDDPSTSAVDDPTVVTIVPVAAVTLTKTGVLSGVTQIFYTFVIKNTGNVTLTTLTLTDPVLNLTNFSIALPSGILIPGASVTYTTIYSVSQANRDAGSVTNLATATGKDAAGHTGNSTSGVVISVPKSPVAANDVSGTTSNQPVVISILTNDSPGSVPFDPTSIEIMTQPAHGTVKANSDGTVTYTPTIGYSGPDSFTYRVKDIYGYYTNIATVTVTDVFEGIKIPTMFTPNGDGVNDVFEIRNLNQYAHNELIIVNRWGNEVYRQTDYQNTWSGTGLNEGTYYYLLRLKIGEGTDWQVFKGYVTLIRTLKK